LMPNIGYGSAKEAYNWVVSICLKFLLIDVTFIEV